jgi:hypothetical protein
MRIKKTELWSGLQQPESLLDLLASGCPLSRWQCSYWRGNLPPAPPILYQRLPYSLKAFLFTHTKMRIMEILNFSLFCHTYLFVIQPRRASILSFSCFILNKISDRNLWTLYVCSVHGVTGVNIKIQITAHIYVNPTGAASQSVPACISLKGL